MSAAFVPLVLALAEFAIVVVGGGGGGVAGVDPDALRSAFKAVYHPGDQVVGSPPQRSVVAMGMVGEQLGVRAAAYGDSSGFERATEISLDGSSSREVRGWGKKSEVKVGGARVRLWENPHPQPIRYDFVAALMSSETMVSYGPAGGSGMACPRVSSLEVDLPSGLPIPWAPAQRFACGVDPLAFVGVTIMRDAAGTVRRCVWTYPTVNAVRIEYSRVPGGTVLRANVGLGAIEGGGRSSHVVVRIRAGGALLSQRDLEGSAGLESYDVAAPMLEQGGEVGFEVVQLAQAQVPVCLEVTLR